MEDGREPQRIEIELTAHEPEAAGGPPIVGSPTEPDEPVVGEPSEGGWLSSERNRLVTACAGVGVLALALGVVIGRTGPEGAVSTGPVSTPTSSTVLVDSTVRSSRDTLPPVRPTTTRPTPTTLPVIAEPAPVDITIVNETLVDVHPELAELPLEVIVLTVDGQLLRIDASTGRALSTHVPTARNSPLRLHAGDGWILVPGAGGIDRALVYADDFTATTIQAPAEFPMLRQPGTDVFWVVGGESGTDLQEVTPVSVHDGATGETVRVPGFPEMIDPLGGVVTEAPGGSYVVAADGTSRLTPGQAIAVGQRTILVHECTAELDCEYAQVDRESGDRRALDLDRALTDRGSFSSSLVWGIDDPFNANEDALLVTTWEQFSGGAPRSGVLDLTTGRFVEIGGSFDFASLRWAPDGRHVFFLRSGSLNVFVRETGETIAFAGDLNNLTAFAIRPAIPSVDDPVTDDTEPVPTTEAEG